MTAPTEYDDEAKLRRFIRAKPYHTGHHLSPKQLNDDTTSPWWFVDESAVERYEEAHHRLFCRECAAPRIGKVGHTYTPLLVDYQKNPLTDPPVLASTHCPNCGGGEMYPIEKLTWSINDAAVSEIVRPVAIQQDEFERMMMKQRYNAIQQQFAQSQQGALSGPLGNIGQAYGQNTGYQGQNLQQAIRKGYP